MDHSSPATKGDLATGLTAIESRLSALILQAIGHMTAQNAQLNDAVQKSDIRIQKIDEKLDMHDRKLDALYHTDDQILTILSTMDRRLTAHTKDHERRLVALERRTA